MRASLPSLAATLALFVVPAITHAEELTIVPQTVDSSAPIEQALQENAGSASVRISGKGSAFRITYRATEPLTIFMTPLQADDRFSPSDFLTFTLPISDSSAATIDLTVSPGWSPREQMWLLHILTKNEEADAGFSTMDFVPSSPLTVVRAFLRHSFKTEPYTPSSYHALLGYRAYGYDLTFIFGIILFVVCAIVAIFAKRKMKIASVLLVLVGFQMLYGLRFGIDLVRYAAEHIPGYAAGTYDEAGSVYQIATVLREEKMHSVFVCRSGTNYKEKILRYAAYPIVVTSDPTLLDGADAVMIMNAANWRFDGSSLFCDDLFVKATKASDFPDGSILFRVTR